MNDRIENMARLDQSDFVVRNRLKQKAAGEDIAFHTETNQARIEKAADDLDSGRLSNQELETQQRIIGAEAVGTQLVKRTLKKQEDKGVEHFKTHEQAYRDLALSEATKDGKRINLHKTEQVDESVADAVEES